MSTLGKLLVQYLPLLIPMVTAIIAWRATQPHRPESGRLATHGSRQSLFNGYAPLIADMVDRLEQYRKENEALRLEVAELKARERVREAVPSQTPTRARSSQPRQRRQSP